MIVNRVSKIYNGTEIISPRNTSRQIAVVMFIGIYAIYLNTTNIMYRHTCTPKVTLREYDTHISKDFKCVEYLNSYEMRISHSLIWACITKDEVVVFDKHISI